MMESIKAFFLGMGFLDFAKPTVFTFIFTMAMVYGFGKILYVTKTSVGKNRVALVSCLVFGPLEMLKMIPQNVEGCLMVVSIGIIAYTLIGMRLFSRIDNWQDEKFAKDRALDEEAVFVERPKKRPIKAKKP